MYRIALRLIKEDLDRPADIADALCVVLLTWNNAAYRYGRPDFEKLKEFLTREQRTLAALRSRHISSLVAAQEGNDVSRLFKRALDALSIGDTEKKSPVGVAKALHLLAPNFFPLWDRAIAQALGFRLISSIVPNEYLRFMQLMQAAAKSLEDQYRVEREGLPKADSLAAALSRLSGQQKTMLKLLDEYYYSKFTKCWIP